MSVFNRWQNYVPRLEDVPLILDTESCKTDMKISYKVRENLDYDIVILASQILNSLCLQTIADVIRTCLGPRSMLKVSCCIEHICESMYDKINT